MIKNWQKLGGKVLRFSHILFNEAIRDDLLLYVFKKVPFFSLKYLGFGLLVGQNNTLKTSPPPDKIINWQIRLIDENENNH